MPFIIIIIVSPIELQLPRLEPPCIYWESAAITRFSVHSVSGYPTLCSLIRGPYSITFRPQRPSVFRGIWPAPMSPQWANSHDYHGYPSLSTYIFISDSILWRNPKLVEYSIASWETLSLFIIRAVKHLPSFHSHLPSQG